METDHLPLVRIFEKPLHQVPLRLQKMRMCIQHYGFKLVAKAGKDIPLAGALSRAYLPTTEPNLQEEIQNFDVFPVELPSIAAFRSSTLDEVRKETTKDTSLQKIIQLTNKGWPTHRQT